MKLTKQEIEQIVMPRFFEHAEKLGFTPFLEKYLERKGSEYPLKLYLSPQLVIIKEFLNMVFGKTRTTLSVSLSRQYGKTEVFSHLISFCLKYHKHYIKKKFSCVVLAPEKNTGTVIFDRTIQYLPFDFFDKKKRGLMREDKHGNSLEVFSLYEEGGSTFEGRTIDLVIRDECHLGSDMKYKDQIRPTLIRTAGSVCQIGNGTFRECEFFKCLRKGDTEEAIVIGGEQAIFKNVVVRRDYTQLKDYMIDLAEKGVSECFDWVAGVEKEIADSGINSIEVRKNIFCQGILTVEGFVSEEEVKKKSKFLQWDGKSPVFMSIDIAKHIDRTVVMFANDKMEVFDMLILKEAQERKEIMEQFADLRDYCDEMEYTQHLEIIGADETGMGEAAVEILQQEMPAQIVGYKFTAKDKHQWYTGLQSRILTQNDAESVWLNSEHPLFEELLHELTTLEVKTAANGDYLRFAAPEKTGHYDDFVASLAILTSLVSRHKGHISTAKTYEQRFPTKTDPKKPRSTELVELPSHLQQKKNTQDYMSAY